MALLFRTVVFGVALLGLSAEARPRLDDRRMGQLSRYDVLLFSDPAGGGLYRHKAIGVFDASPEDVFKVATTYERYSEYMPRVTQSQIVWQSGELSMVYLAADLPWPLSNAWIYARFQHDPQYDQTFRVRFAMVRGNLLRYEGSLLIEPFGDGRTAVTYELLAQPDSRLPRALLQSTIGRGAANFVHCLRGRINALLHKGLLHAPSRPRIGAAEPSEVDGAAEPPGHAPQEAEGDEGRGPTYPPG
jgi:ribosome-associated toxin RatA of RatAB toxin-antitoxin module